MLELIYRNLMNFRRSVTMSFHTPGEAYTEKQRNRGRIPRKPSEKSNTFVNTAYNQRLSSQYEPYVTSVPVNISRLDCHNMHNRHHNTV
ncbi:unnamed protein product [Schistosoma bovis]|nr:unnamed protein product [Schistosoma bovis]